MSERNLDFNRFFQKFQQFSPYAWQLELSRSLECGNRVIRIETGYGKTLGVLLTWLYHRCYLQNSDWPLRLVWMLPMRVLVEQTRQEAERVLGKFRQEFSSVTPIEVSVLMGGADTPDWHLSPEQPAILIGTQDMLLSRAMNRGYACARARWPVDFGLLSQDSLWVLDEVQLMDVGFATAIQLATYRLEREPTWLRPTYTWAMSATLQDAWLSKSPDTAPWVSSLLHHSLTDSDRLTPLWADTFKPLEILADDKKLSDRVVHEHLALECPDPLTLLVCNTVDAAREQFKKISAQAKNRFAVHLLHSRFRGKEREHQLKGLLGAQAGSRIVVATQVVEAGVDISAHLLFTYLCPWSSLVQRFGRVARRGGTGRIFVVDFDLSKASSALPYESEELQAVRDALNAGEGLRDGSPRCLNAFELANSELLESLYPYEPEALLLRQEIEELFDTSPDLSGADLDVSRFIRSGEERDVQICWFGPEEMDVLKPGRRLRPVGKSLVSVPFLRAREWLFGKDAQKLPAKTQAWIWSYQDGDWHRPERKDLWPGQTVLVHYEVGGYDLQLGWDKDAKTPVEVVPLKRPRTQQELADSSDQAEDLSVLGDSTEEDSWEISGQTILFHSQQVRVELETIARELRLPHSLSQLLSVVARWHDIGKAFAAFQGALDEQLERRPPRRDLAKGPRWAWRSVKKMYVIGADSDAEPKVRPGFRHELASVLAWLSIRAKGPSASALEQEIVDLQEGQFDLGAYLVCSHHGKIRCRMHAGKSDSPEIRAIRGIRGTEPMDHLPAVWMEGPIGPGILPTQPLSLEPALLGRSVVTGRSWTDRVESLRQVWGPFALAYLEALVRAADVRASQSKNLRDNELWGNPYAG